MIAPAKRDDCFKNRKTVGNNTDVKIRCFPPPLPYQLTLEMGWYCNSSDGSPRQDKRP